MPGASPSLAHPVRYRLSSGARKQLLGDFAAAGGGALEVVSGGNGAQHSETCAVLALQFGLAGSIGSDFHNPQLAWNPLGRLAKLPDCIVPVWRGSIYKHKSSDLSERRRKATSIRTCSRTSSGCGSCASSIATSMTSFPAYPWTSRSMSCR